MPAPSHRFFAMSAARPVLVCVCAALAVVAAGCGGVSASDCRAAALAQAESENAWGSAIEAHDMAHATGIQDHSEFEEQLLTSRVDLIIASAGVQRACQ